MTALSNTPLVMVWRRVQDMAAARRTAETVNRWPGVGGDSYSTMYDAGNLLIAYWNQTEFMQEQAGAVDPVILSSSCSDQNFVLHSTGFNPSNQLTLAVGDTGFVAESLSSLAGRPLRPVETRDRLGRAISFVDDVGNTTRFVRLSDEAVRDGIGRRLKSLEDAGLSSKSFHPVIGYELLVSNLGASRSFYSNVLGLREGPPERDSVFYDTGNVFLSLRTEPSTGLVSSIERSGKLGDDLVVFHVSNVEAVADTLSQRGVQLPHGIEDSQHGRLAVFKDPDGHVLAAWQAPPRVPQPRINYFPVLDRLLANATYG